MAGDNKVGRDWMASGNKGVRTGSAILAVGSHGMSEKWRR